MPVAVSYARKQTIAPMVLDLNETVAGMLQMLKRLIGEDIQLTWLSCADLWPVKVDPPQIDQMLANLCVNARDAIKGVGKVTIQTDNVRFDEKYCREHDGFNTGDYIAITVDDTGCGIDKNTLDHLFEPFFTMQELAAKVRKVLDQPQKWIQFDAVNLDSLVKKLRSLFLVIPAKAGIL